MKAKINTEKLNNMARQDVNRIIEYSERKYHNEILWAAEHIDQHKKEQKIILIAGPSASGKTTTATLLFEYLAELGVRTQVISLDDFFLDNADALLFPDGTKDFESVNALDIPRLHKCFCEMLEKGKTMLPVFDFETGMRSGERELIITDHVVIVEGIHALNPLIIPPGYAGNIYRVYISVNSEFECNGEIVISARDMRLIRRMLRDQRHRNKSVNNTLDMWKNVLEGEKQYILPFRCYADETIDSLHLYEPLLYRDMLIPMLDSQIKDIYCEKIKQISQGLAMFSSISSDLVPKNSLINEFIK